MKSHLKFFNSFSKSTRILLAVGFLSTMMAAPLVLMSDAKNKKHKPIRITASALGLSGAIALIIGSRKMIKQVDKENKELFDTLDRINESADEIKTNLEEIIKIIMTTQLTDKTKGS